MAWVKAIERTPGDGKLQPTQLAAHVKVFTPKDSLPIVQIDTYGSEERKIPGKQSQTLQFGKEAAFELYKILKDTYGF
ncbi:hypothetical protein HYPGJ_30841 [Hyphomicrobium sp. GJ21]|jgi:hypothetical protein|uniref:hypothetical protein n=1 Tax=Hyphomicrobium sp. GJ21 TaxID=113574 RepID=UPI000622BDB5|nr:hypothetical protein [Hyphomicrobium sp. GJ21]CEJ86986.1 hypothetical protein HYPGJ_30841 [Hyphomicrobium sp. GJ21]